MAALTILYMIGTLDRGGTEGQLMELATRLDARRFRPVVCSLSSGGPHAETLSAAGIPVRVIGFRGLKRGIWNPLSLPKIVKEFGELVRFVRLQRPAIVHSFLFWAYILGTYAARAAGVPTIISSRRGLGHFKAKKPHYLLLERLANRWTNLLVANSEAVKQDVITQEGVAAAKIRVVYNGIDADRYMQPHDPNLRRELGLPIGVPVVGVVANFIHYKGHRVFLDACCRLRAARPDARFLLIGDGPCRAELERRTIELKLGEAVRFLGSREDIPELLAQINIAALPSMEEGFPNAVLEAMAAGIPVVASRVGGVPEAIVDGSTGFLVTPGEPEELAGSILALLNDPARAEAMGRAGRRRVVERFGITRMVEETQAIYEELLGDPGP